MIKKFVSWLYLRVVYLPEFKKKVEQAHPGAKITYLSADDYHDMEAERRFMRQACFERERIPNDHLH